jgi:hypothetical protein
MFFVGIELKITVKLLTCFTHFRVGHFTSFHHGTLLKLGPAAASVLIQYKSWYKHIPNLLGG